MELYNLSLKEASEGLKRKELSSRELTEACLGRIEHLEGTIGAFITVTADKALDGANQADDAFGRGEIKSPLQGIPGSLKDLFVTEGVTTTSGSKILKNYKPPYTATSVRRLEGAGYVSLGKTNMDEFSQGSSTENSAYGSTKNPWDVTRVPGGSSGGSAAAVAAGMGFFSLAEDTGGSIRQPASFCNVTGLKPTYGRLSRYGIIAYGSSLDCPGPMARTVEDVALLMNHLAGHDPLDATSAQEVVPDYTTTLKEGINGLKIGLPREYFGEGIDSGVKKVLLDSIGVLELLGARAEEISLPHTKYAVAAYYLTVKSEVSSNLARYDGIRYGLSTPEAADFRSQYLLTREKGFGDEVKRGIMLGTYALSAGYYDQYYLRAQKVRTLIRHELDQAFQKYDLLITPVSPFPAFKLGEKLDDPLKMYLADAYTVTVNLSGVPALAVPAGFSDDNLPIGMQILGPQFSEETLLRAGYSYQQATDWHKRRPEIKSKTQNSKFKA